MNLLSNTLVFNDIYEAYPFLVRCCDGSGVDLITRGLKCRELRPCSFIIRNPSDTLYMCPTRRINTKFWAIETLGYIAGRSDKVYTDLLCHVNSKYDQFKGTDDTLIGAYGPRMIKSIPDILDELSQDFHSRKCVCSIWDSGFNNNVSKNTYCTCVLHFFSDGKDKLNLSVYMRSNDLDWGVPYDIPAFCAILNLVAGCLGAEVGSYYHNAGSLHLYKDHQPAIDLNLDSILTNKVRIPTPPKITENARSNFLTIRETACEFINLLHKHRGLNGGIKKPWSTFSVICENGAYNQYWRFWTKMVQHRWSSN